MTPLWLLKYLPNMPASHVAIYNDMRGPNNSITLREASANLAVGEAFRTIQRGHADLMVAGATGTRVHPMKMVHVVSQEEVAGNGADPARASRPFDLKRSGMVLGEGGRRGRARRTGHGPGRGAGSTAKWSAPAPARWPIARAVAHRDKALVNAMQRAPARRRPASPTTSATSTPTA